MTFHDLDVLLIWSFMLHWYYGPHLCLVWMILLMRQDYLAVEKTFLNSENCLDARDHRKVAKVGSFAFQ